MQLSTILSPGRTLCGMPGNSKKRTLLEVARFIANDIGGINADELFDKLIARERLGSTSLGQGIAIPHCRIKSCHQVVGSLIKLDNSIDFDAIDGNRVDLLFVLLVPEQAHDEHLKVLAALAERFSNADYCQSLRDATNHNELYSNATA